MELVNTEAERGVLGSCLIGDMSGGRTLPLDIALDAGCDESWFYTPRHQHLWLSMVQIHTDGNPVDLLTVGQRLKEDGRLDSIGGYEFIESLVDDTPTAAHIEYYLGYVQQEHKKRRIKDLSLDAIERVSREGDIEIDRIIADLSVGLTDIVSVDEGKTIDEMMDDNVTVLNNACKGIVSGIPLPWPIFSAQIGGLQKGSMTPIVGRDGKGKSGMVAQCLDFWAGEKIPTLCFSLEDDPRRTLLRMAGCRQWFSARDVEGGMVSEGRRRVQMVEVERAKNEVKILKYKEWMKDKPFFPESGTFTAEEIVAKIRHHHRVNGIEVVVIDGFKDIDFSFPSKGDTENEKHTAKLLAGVVKDLNIAGGIVSHINKIDDDIPITKEKITGSSAQYKGARQVLIFQDAGIPAIATVDDFVLSATKANFASGGSVLLRRDPAVLKYQEMNAG